MLFGIMAYALSCIIFFAVFLSLQLVFLFLTGEAWGYLGSRRFLAELEASSIDVRGLNGTLIEQVSFYYTCVCLLAELETCMPTFFIYCIAFLMLKLLVLGILLAYIFFLVLIIIFCFSKLSINE